MDIELKDFLVMMMMISWQSLFMLLFKRENDELPTNTSSSRLGPTITVAELAKQRFVRILKNGRSGGVVVKLLACGERDKGSIPGLVATISEIGYLLLPRRNVAERSLKRH